MVSQPGQQVIRQMNEREFGTGSAIQLQSKLPQEDRSHRVHRLDGGAIDQDLFRGQHQVMKPVSEYPDTADVNDPSHAIDDPVREPCFVGFAIGRSCHGSKFVTVQNGPVKNW
jgi:hypothetical protein